MSLSEVPQDLQPHLDDIAERLYSGHVALMVGAGFSRNAVDSTQSGRCFPDWKRLGDSLYELLHEEPPSESIRYLSIPGLAQDVHAAHGRDTLEQFLLDAIPDNMFEPSPLHMRLLSLPWRDVFTTNYDTLLERAGTSVLTRPYEVVLTEADLISSSRPRIVKLHGSFPSTRPFIITTEDYRRYPKSFPVFVNTVQQSLVESTVCLIGFSGNDPNFLEWTGWVRDALGTHRQPNIYLLASRLSDSERNLLEQRRIIGLEFGQSSELDDRERYTAIEQIIDYLECKKKPTITWTGPRLSRS